MACIEIKNLNFKYPNSTKYALENINLTVQEGEIMLVCGKSGSSKTTLLRHLKPNLAPMGEKTGEVLFFNEDINTLSNIKQASEIGFVAQDLNNNIVTDKVWHELAFSLESIGTDSKTMRIRVAEMASFFNLEKIFYKSVNELSGGQKQILSLASVMAVQPKLLILDEPTSQLDPVAAVDFLSTVKRINRELGTTVIMSEHRLCEAFTMANRVAVMDSSRLICVDTPENTAKFLYKSKHPMYFAMPSYAKITLDNSKGEECALSVSECKRFIENNFSQYKTDKKPNFESEDGIKSKSIFCAKNVCFKYEKNADDVLKDLSMNVKKGEIHCILGGNGAGKSTLLSVIAKIRKPYSGKIKHNCNSVSLLVQDPKCVFVKKTIKEELEASFNTKHLSKEQQKKLIEAVETTEIGDVLNMHPYDVSGGELQRAGIAKLLLCDSELLLLDEPTKGMDSFYKRKFGELLLKLKKMGKTVIIASHDVEFCAEYGDMCSLLFMGSITTENEPHEFFAENSFYTTTTNKAARSVFKYAVVPKEVQTFCNLKK